MPDLYHLAAEDVQDTVMAAACWVMGIRMAQNDNVRDLAERITNVAEEVGVPLKPYWWESDEPPTLGRCPECGYLDQKHHSGCSLTPPTTGEKSAVGWRRPSPNGRWLRLTWRGRYRGLRRG